MTSLLIARASKRGLPFALAAGLLAATAMAPAIAAADAADQSQSDQQPATVNTPIPDATIGKAGAALRDISKVQQTFAGKMNGASSDDEKRGLSEQANAQAIEAIQSHGLSLQEYSNVVRTARSDPQLKQRLLDAANKSQQ